MYIDANAVRSMKKKKFIETLMSPEFSLGLVFGAMMLLSSLEFYESELEPFRLNILKIK